MTYYDYDDFKPYVSVGDRRRANWRSSTLYRLFVPTEPTESAETSGRGTFQISDSDHLRTRL